MNTVWRHRLLAGLAAIAIPAAFFAAFVIHSEPPNANGVTARHVASALQAATAPYDPIVILAVTRVADSPRMAHAIEHQCVLGRHPVTLLSTVQWEGSATTVAWALRQETRPPGCHDIELTLPFPPADQLTVPHLSVVEIPIRPDGQLGAPVTFGAR